MPPIPSVVSSAHVRVRAFENPAITLSAEAKPTRQALSTHFKAYFGLLGFVDDEFATIDSRDLASIAADRTLVVQVGLAVIADPAGLNGQGIVAAGLRFELPSEQHVARFEHQIPMLARRRLVV